MNVGIDQAGDDCTSLKIDDSSLRCGNLPHVGGGAEHEDSSVVNGERFASGKAVIDGKNLAVHQNRVGRLSLNRHDSKNHQTEDSRNNVSHGFVIVDEAYTGNAYLRKIRPSCSRGNKGASVGRTGRITMSTPVTSSPSFNTMAVASLIDPALG